MIRFELSPEEYAPFGDKGGPLMIEKPHITETTAQLTAIIHLTIPREEMQKVFGPAIGELMAAMAAQGLAPCGPVFAHHLKMSPDTFDFELGVPVDAPIVAAGRVEPLWECYVVHPDSASDPAAWRTELNRPLAK